MTHQQLRPLVLFALVCLALLAVGCDEEKLETRYGRRTGASVNGTGVLAKLFQQAGSSVVTRINLTPETARTADVIVWFPNAFVPPSAAHIKWFNTWLSAQPGRTLIYVGRGYDAAPDYWREVQNRGLSKNPAVVAANLNNEIARVKSEMSLLPANLDVNWFQLTRRALGTNLQFGGSWQRGPNLPRPALEAETVILTDKFSPHEVLLSVTGSASKIAQPLVVRIPINASQVLAVADGSFTLNYPLIDPENRKLADRLINQAFLNNYGTRVVFLESGPGDPEILDHDLLSDEAGAWDMFRTRPLGIFLCHLAVLGVLYCFMRWPIFGRPRPADTGEELDFGRHLDALGQMLQRGKDERFARTRLAQYQATLGDQQRRSE